MPSITERHRHRYEVNNEYREALAAAGLTFSGLSPDHRLVEAVELENHPFFVGVQYHPEFKSRPNRAHSYLPRICGSQLAAQKINSKICEQNPRKAGVLSCFFVGFVIG